MTFNNRKGWRHWGCGTAQRHSDGYVRQSCCCKARELETKLTAAVARAESLQQERDAATAEAAVLREALSGLADVEVMDGLQLRIGLGYVHVPIFFSNMIGRAKAALTNPSPAVAEVQRKVAFVQSLRANVEAMWDEADKESATAQRCERSIAMNRAIGSVLALDKVLDLISDLASEGDPNANH
jgi:hypothetical protein